MKKPDTKQPKRTTTKPSMIRAIIVHPPKDAKPTQAEKRQVAANLKEYNALSGTRARIKSWSKKKA